MRLLHFALITTAMLLTLSSKAVALDIKYINKGDVLYQNKFVGEDPRVLVVEVYEDRVKVRRLNGENAGDVDFVAPSSLLTREQYDAADTQDSIAKIGIGAAIIGAIYCASDEENCKSTDNAEEKK